MTENNAQQHLNDTVHYSTEYTDVYIGIGSNLLDPVKQVSSAIAALKTTPHIEYIKTSPWYQSKAIGPGDQADYLNGILHIKTCLNAEDLLTILQDIEAQHDRKRILHWGPRTLDLDIILFGTHIINSKRLTVPHKMAHTRNFVIYPLADIDNSLIIQKKTVRDIQKILGNHGLIQLNQLESFPLDYEESVLNTQYKKELSKNDMDHNGHD